MNMEYMNNVQKDISPKMSVIHLTAILMWASEPF